MPELTPRWQQYFATIVKAVSSASKDPSTQVGALIYRPDLSIASTGFNGLPRGMFDSPLKFNDPDKDRARAWKYPRIVHAEANALAHKRECVRGYGMVVTAPPCSKCALQIISHGIQTVYTIPASPDLLERWKEELELSEELFKEAGVAFYQIL